MHSVYGIFLDFQFLAQQSESSYSPYSKVVAISWSITMLAYTITLMVDNLISEIQIKISEILTIIGFTIPSTN